jgi:hypothetical protein
MRSSLLDVAEGHACVGGGGDERLPQGMRPDGLVDPGISRYAAHETASYGAAKAPPVGADKDRPGKPFPDGKVDCPSRPPGYRHSHNFAALAQRRQGAVPRSSPMASMSAPIASDTEPIEREERDEGVLGWCTKPRSDQKSTDLVAVEPDSIALVVETRAADVNCWRGGYKPRVATEAGDRAQPPGDSCPGSASLLGRSGVELDVGTADRQEPETLPLAPGDELAQVERVGLPGEPAVAGEVPCQRKALGVSEDAVDDGRGSR